jgi:hypothetical protein
MSDDGLCKSCREGKCEDCYGDFWDEDTEQFLTCQCTHEGSSS